MGFHQVNQNGKISREANLVEKDMCGVLNLLDVALNFCTSSRHEMNSESFMGLHKGAFRTLYRVALGVRGMAERAISSASIINEYSENGGTWQCFCVGEKSRNVTEKFRE